mmetsp:Transcript_35567/g.66402  ORF Transcript_35567/g.66402 Transcript_35567/m.66402 type:complete len:202 (-) Transcript_35567:118-723(-)
MGNSQRQGQVQAAPTASTLRRHIRWTRSAGEKYQKELQTRRLNSSLGEMVVCGGLRCNVLLARVVVDEANHPGATIMLESLTLPGCKHVEVAEHMLSARIGFHGRDLCEATHHSFAVTRTSGGRCVSEFGLRVLRTELPAAELESTRLRQKILWNVFKEARYRSAAVLKTVIKLQSVFRRRLAARYTRRLRTLKRCKTSKK